MASEPVPLPHMRGAQARQNGQHRHELGPQALHRAFHDRVLRIPVGEEAPLVLGPVVGDVEVEEHDHPGFGVQTRRGQ